DEVVASGRSPGKTSLLPGEPFTSVRRPGARDRPPTGTRGRTRPSGLLPHRVLPHQRHHARLLRSPRDRRTKPARLHRRRIEHLLIEPVADLVEDPGVGHAVRVDPLDPPRRRRHRVVGTPAPAVLDMLTL